MTLLVMHLVVGVSIIGVHSTSELNNVTDCRTNVNEPTSNIDVHPFTRRCHFTMVSIHDRVIFLIFEAKLCSPELRVSLQMRELNRCTNLINLNNVLQ